MCQNILELNIESANEDLLQVVKPLLLQSLTIDKGFKDTKTLILISRFKNLHKLKLCDNKISKDFELLSLEVLVMLCQLEELELYGGECYFNPKIMKIFTE